MLPRAVRAQAERAERLLQKSMAENTGQPPAPADPEPQAPVDVVPEPAPEPQPAPTPEPTADPLDLKYKVLKGKYDAEVPRLSAENRELKNKLTDLERQIESLRAAPAPAAHEVSQEIASTYGDEFVAAVDSIAETRTKKLRDELTSDVESLKATATQAARATFMANLERLVPDYEAIDRNPEFTAWLDEFDPMTGRVRRDFFQEADTANDAARIATFFASFARSKATQQKPGPRSVDHLIAPDSSAKTETQQGKKLWTRAEINRVYGDARARRISQEVFLKLDADITAAQAEGRIVN